MKRPVTRIHSIKKMPKDDVKPKKSDKASKEDKPKKEKAAKEEKTAKEEKPKKEKAAKEEEKPKKEAKEDKPKKDKEAKEEKPKKKEAKEEKPKKKEAAKEEEEKPKKKEAKKEAKEEKPSKKDDKKKKDDKPSKKAAAGYFLSQAEADGLSKTVMTYMSLPSTRSNPMMMMKLQMLVQPAMTLATKGNTTLSDEDYRSFLHVQAETAVLAEGRAASNAGKVLGDMRQMAESMEKVLAATSGIKGMLGGLMGGIQPAEKNWLQQSAVWLRAVAPPGRADMPSTEERNAAKEISVRSSWR